MEIAIIGDLGIDYYENLNVLKPGGIAFNFAYNLIRSGEDNVSLISILGNDKASNMLMSVSKKVGLDISHIQQVKGSAPKQNIFLDKGERKFTGYNPGVLKKWKLTKKNLAFIKKQDVVFVPLSDGMEHVFNAVKKTEGPTKAVDFSQDYEFVDFDKKENVITKNAKYFDVIFVGGKKKYLKMITSVALKYPEKVIVLTLGAGGSIGFYQKQVFKQKAIKAAKIIDTTGCGDAFQAGFLACWLKTNNIKMSLIQGTKQALSIIKHVGSTPLTLK